MGEIEIGGKGLAEVNLTIPQGTSLTLNVYHTDSNGNPIDHTGSTFAMAFQTKDRKTTIDLSSCVTGTSTKCVAAIRGSMTATLDITTYNWDLIATMSTGDVVRLAYGKATIVDTQALDT